MSFESLWVDVWSKDAEKQTDDGNATELEVLSDKPRVALSFLQEDTEPEGLLSMLGNEVKARRSPRTWPFRAVWGYVLAVFGQFWVILGPI